MANILEIAQNNLGQEGIAYVCSNVSYALDAYDKLPTLYSFIHSSDFQSFYKHFERINDFRHWVESNKDEIMSLIISYLSCGDFDALSIYCGFITKEEFDNTISQIYLSFLEERNVTGLAKEVAKSWIEYQDIGTEFETSFCEQLGALDNCTEYYGL